jgi:hypothetical protein
MINVGNKILKAWYEMLNNQLSVPVFRTDAPAEQEGNYVIIRIESDSSNNTNNQRFISNPVVITDVVTKFKTEIDDGLAVDIDNEISLLLHSTPATHNLPSQDGIGITRVRRESATYLPEDDGTFRYMRIVTRNTHRVEQLTLT